MINAKIIGTFATACVLIASGGIGTKLLPSAVAAEAVATKLPACKPISQKSLEKYKSISISVDDKGQAVKFDGVPLRVLLAEMMPEMAMETMKECNSLARRALVMEAIGDDGYPGMVTTLEVAMNKSGDRYIIATHRDGKPIESGPQLVCRLDEAHTRWVRSVVRLRIAEVPEITADETKNCQ